MKKLLREPLLHFLLLGALLVGVASLRRGPAASGSGAIVVSQARIDHLIDGFTMTWQRPPTQEELGGLVEDYIKEEIFVREALAMGLDRDDTIVRRRLRQKLEFITGDSLAGAPPTDDDLQAFLSLHAEKFRREPQVALQQVFLDRDKHGAALQDDARKLIAQLEAAEIDVSTLGDSLMLPSYVELLPLSQIARLFGDEFAASVVALAPGRWSGPITSGYGGHLVRVTEHVDGRAPELAEVRGEVEREYATALHSERSETFYRELRSRYTITIEPLPAPTAPPPLTTTSTNSAQLDQ